VLLALTDGDNGDGVRFILPEQAKDFLVSGFAGGGEHGIGFLHLLRHGIGRWIGRLFSRGEELLPYFVRREMWMLGCY